MVDSATPLPPSPVIDGCNASALREALRAPAQPCSTWRFSASTSTAAPTPSGSIGLGWRPPGSSTSSGG